MFDEEEDFDEEEQESPEMHVHVFLFMTEIVDADAAHLQENCGQLPLRWY